MPLYGLATIALMQQLPSGVEQIWYANDTCACWMFVSQAVPFDSVLFQPLEDVIHQVFIP